MPRSLIDWYRTPEGRWFRDSMVADEPTLAAPSAATTMLSDPIERAAAATAYLAHHHARALKLDREVGTVQVGKRANLLLVRADPTKTIQAYQEIVKVILGGRVLNPSALAADRPE